MNSLNIFTDGGARGNPGPAAIGFVIKGNQEEILGRVGKYLGRATNNVAEYQAVIAALKWLASHQKIIVKYQLMNFHLDSNLVVNQLNGNYKIKDLKLKRLAAEIKELEKVFLKKIFYKFIPRTKNYQADFLVNQTLNQQKNF